MTVADETGWEFDTMKRIYSNVGLDKGGETTLVAWKIVHPAPGSTALKPEEMRQEKLIFALRPQDGKRFTIRATVRYFFAPPPQAGFGPEPPAPEMAKATLTIPGKPRTTNSQSWFRGTSRGKAQIHPHPRMRGVVWNGASARLDRPQETNG